VLSTVTAEPRSSRSVFPATAAHRIVGAEHRNRGAEEQPIGLPGDGRKDNLGCRDRKIAAVVLADPERIDAGLLREHSFGDDIAQRVRVRARVAGVVNGEVAEGVEAKLKRVRHRDRGQTVPIVSGPRLPRASTATTGRRTIVVLRRGDTR
jgi:hypothetical protein